MSLPSAQRPRTLVPTTQGFSTPESAGIRSMQDLLRIIQPLELPLFESAILHNHAEIGEGSCYRVFRCNDRRSGRFVAVKEIKLRYNPSQHWHFQRLVHYVLRDLEVMHHEPIATHPNVIGLLGYGWGLMKESILPFMVTEFAELGCMRDYLATCRPSIRLRLTLCSQVTAGLAELHRSGVMHGDLKLENVLIIGNEKQVVAKLADFSHSFLLAKEKSVPSMERYLGTIGYLAPELFAQEGTDSLIDSEKCDIWALGLLCWEGLMNGERYWRGSSVKTLLDQAMKETSRLDQHIFQIGDRSEKQLPTKESFFAIAEQILPAALEHVQTLWKPESLDPFLVKFVRGMFSATLQPDPKRRKSDAASLPIKVFARDTPLMNQTLLSQNNSEGFPSFASFQPASISRLPYRAKIQVVSDWKYVASTKKDAVQAGIAAANVAMAYGTGYGVEYDFNSHQQWLKKSADLGFPIVSTLRDFWKRQSHLSEKSADWEADRNLHLEALCKIFRRKAAGEILEMEPNDKRRTILTQVPGLFDLCQRLLGGEKHFSCPGGVEPCPQSMYCTSQGTPPLLLACQLGEQSAVQILLALGEDPLASSKEDCLPLHFAFMFEQLSGDPIKLIHSLLPTERHRWRNVLGRVAALNSTNTGLYPFPAQGSPLSFAVFAGCKKVCHRLLEAGAQPLDFHKKQSDLPSSPLYIAISLHQSEIFHLLWQYFVTIPESTGYTLDYTDSGGSVALFAALSARSILDTTLVHGSRADAARRDTLRILLRALALLRPPSIEKANMQHNSLYMNPLPATETSSVLRMPEPGETTFLEDLNLDWVGLNSVAFGLMRILELGDLEMADAVLDLLEENMNVRELTYGPQTEERKVITKMVLPIAFQMACQGSLSPTRSLALLNSGIRHGHLSDQCISLRALGKAIQYHSELIFRHCLERIPLVEQALKAEGGPLLHQMIASGFSGLVPISCLLSRGVDADWADEKGRTALHLAAQAGLEVEVNELLMSGALVIADQHGNTPLHEAVKSGTDEVVRCIADHVPAGIIDLLNKDHVCALTEAVVSNTPGAFELLLLRGAKVDFDDGIHSPIHWCAENGRLAMLKELLSRGANVNCKDKEVNTPLHRIFFGKSNAEAEISKALLEADADPCSLNADGKAAIHCALEKLNVEAFIPVFDAFTARQGAVGARDVDGQSVLHYAVKNANVGLVRRLLRSGIESGAVDARSQNALHVLVSQRYSDEYTESNAVVQIVDLLLEADGRLLTETVDGRTALAIAVDNEDRFLVKLLVAVCLGLRASNLRANVRPRQRDCDGELSSVYEDVLRSAYRNANTAMKEYWETILIDSLLVIHQDQLMRVLGSNFRRKVNKYRPSNAEQDRRDIIIPSRPYPERV